MNVHRWLRVLLLLGLAATLLQLAGIVEAAGLTMAVHSVDASQFPKVGTTISVVDSFDVPIDLVGRGLDRSAVTLSEDNAPIGDFQVDPSIDPQQAFAVAILVDSGSSMNDTGKLAATKTALGAFIDAMGPQDSVALLSFSDQVKVLQGYTADKDTLKHAVDQLSANGQKSVYDAISQASQFQAVVSQKRKVLLVVTDGGDTASKQTQAGATTAARNAKVPIYAIGIGPDVHHDQLDQLAGNTTGQVIYAAGAADLTPAFQGFADRLRRLWVISYTSKLPGDDKSHTVNVTVKEPDQTLTGQGTFTAKSNALAFQVSGIVNATRVAGTPAITVTLSNGKASGMQLLVDDQPRGSATTAPFVFNWDTTKETPGIHRVVVRATAADGSNTDREFVVEVLAPTPVAKPTSVSAPTQALPSPTALAPAATSQSGTNPLLYILGGLGIIVVVAAIAGGLFFMSRRKLPKVAIPPVPPPVQPPRTVVPDRTELIVPLDDGATQISGATVVRSAALPSQPRARVRLVQQGTEQEIVLAQPETVLGRDPSNPIVVRDPLASRRHARIVLENGEFWVEDLKSLNGTKINGEVATRHKLATGDQIKIGEAVLTFTADPK
jgi:VWFA-related protein